MTVKVKQFNVRCESYGGWWLVLFTFTEFNVVNCEDHIASVTAVTVSVFEDDSLYTHLTLSWWCLPPETITPCYSHYKISGVEGRLLSTHLFYKPPEAFIFWNVNPQTNNILIISSSLSLSTWLLCFPVSVLLALIKLLIP